MYVKDAFAAAWTRVAGVVHCSNGRERQSKTGAYCPTNFKEKPLLVAHDIMGFSNYLLANFDDPRDLHTLQMDLRTYGSL